MNLKSSANALLTYVFIHPVTRNVSHIAICIELE